jgi:tetratricopeptide (TPR) repeat protein
MMMPLLNQADRRTAAFLSLLLFLLVAAVFYPAVHGGFLYFDEHWHILDNGHVNSGLNAANFDWAFTSLEAANWHPLTWLSHMLDCQVFGLNPAGHHATNIALHALNTALLFLVARQLTGRTWRAAAAAALFGVHPLRVESVAWISERKDVLSLTFFLATLWAYAAYARQTEAKNRRRGILLYVLTLVLSAGGLMCKPTVVTLPLVLLILDYWPLQRFPDVWPRTPRADTGNPKLELLLSEKIPFALLSLLAGGATIVAQERAGMMNYLSLDFPARLANAAVSACRYLGMLFWPHDLCALYPHPGHWPWFLGLGAGPVLVAVTLLTFRARRHAPYLFAGWVWYLITLLPMSGLLQAGPQALADRYTYIPLAGITLALVWAAADAATRLPGRRILVPAITTVAVAASALVTRHQIPFWHDDLAVWNRVLAVTHDNAAAHENLGVVLDEQGRHDEAVKEWLEAVRLNPNLAEAHHRLGNAFATRGRFNEAIQHYTRALELEPGRLVARNNLGFALMQAGRQADAAREFKKILQTDPASPSAHYNLGLLLFQEKRIPSALEQFRIAARGQTNSAEAHFNIGYCLGVEGRFDEALAEFDEALRLKPDYIEAKNNRDAALAMIRSRQTNSAPPAR